MIKALIIEDEEPAALRLRSLIKSLTSDIEILGNIDTVVSAVKWLESHSPPDLIFLDIQLGDGLSFDIFKKVKVDSYIIFTTAFDEYAIKAFELNSIDYLLKPVDETKLLNSLVKVRKFLTASQITNIGKLLETLENRKSNFRKRFLVNISNKIKVIETGEISFFYSNEKNTFLCTTDNRHYPIDFSLDHIEEIINPEIFFRINRQYIVQFRCISKINILSKSRIKIETIPVAPDEMLVSSTRTPEFRVWLDK